MKWDIANIKVDRIMIICSCLRDANTERNENLLTGGKTLPATIGLTTAPLPTAQTSLRWRQAANAERM
ncbi:MAG: hypothetical protein LBK66_06045 [Spirochaetaceae bacterium]|nr:hypothetical protein [Spirochaetaceae bacterium]